MNFTPEQQKAISLRDRNILVSAAAGSGKTAVLVERIIQRVMDKEKPADIDRLLVMTFTKAAADQMRERILAAIEEKRMENPFDRHLQRQSALVHNAKITTIHGFCLDVIRNHFHEIDLDPDFRVGDEGECRLMKQEVLEKVLEAAYAEGNAEFLDMTESLAAKKSDSALESMILKLHDFSMSYPDQEQWLNQCRNLYLAADTDDFENLPWIMELKKSVRLLLSDIREKLKGLLVQIDSKDGPYMYREAVQNDCSLVESLYLAESFRKMQAEFAQLEFATLGREKKGGAFVDPEIKEAVQSGRNKCKKLLTKLAEDYFQETAEEVMTSLQESSSHVKALTSITLSFSKAFALAKRDKNIVDFNDLEHLCLEILTKGKDTTAKEYRDYFQEIYVDEYQDSNLVQETLLKLISEGSTVDTVPEKTSDVFMVGDVKQSIYRFRLARPALFTEKYDTYTQEDSACQRIDLHHNFRSRHEVLDTVNEIFKYIMKKELGNIAYDDAAALHYGADYPEAENDQNKAELLLLSADEEIPDRELEAKAIAAKIKELRANQLVWDKKERLYRPVRYSDIVILLRTNKGWDEAFKTVIAGEGIPVHVTSQAGYFSAIEVKTILEYLRVIDNPLQDIPLAAVMRSVFGGFTDEELALIRAKMRGISLYQAMIAYADSVDGTEDASIKSIELCKKIKSFHEILCVYRKKTAYTPVYYLLLEIIDGDYGNHAAAMPGGERRTANLNMLLKKSEDYGKTSYKGLFHFVRYIEFLQKYEVDFGEANLLDENDDTVRIMSIHKSKGLEFPICFVAGMSKKINYQDARASVVLDVDYGIGIDRVDTKLRTKRATLLKKAAAQKLMLESLAEEMRIFYVALTRAEEKIIMTGVVKDVEKKLSEEMFLTQAASFLDFFVYAKQASGTLSSVKISHPGVHELIEQQVKETVSREAVRESLLKYLHITGRADRHSLEEAQIPEELHERFQFVYPYAEAPDSFAKISVSELKKRSMLHMAEDKEMPVEEKLLYEEPQIVPYIPRFIQNAPAYENAPALHGTAFHRMLEIWDYQVPADEDSIKAYFAEALSKRKLEQELYDAADTAEAARFLKTRLANRMKKAAACDMLYREQPFVIGIEEELIQPIAELGESAAMQEQSDSTLVLVQGIIDAYFIEENEIVIVDYKTDKLHTVGALAERYHAQLNYYAYALQKLTGMKVREKIIYSSYLNKEISIHTEKGETNEI